jgi:hypothetical protein
MNADAVFENTLSFALLADERQRRAETLHGTAQLFIFMRDSALQSHLALWLLPLKPKACSPTADVR